MERPTLGKQLTMDYTRKHDLEELSKALDNAKSRAEKEYYEKMVWRLVGESMPIRSLREDLLKAVRAGDRRAVDRITLHIQRIRLEETNGHSWGNNRGNSKNAN